MANHGVHLAQGSEIVPAADNPLSAQMPPSVQDAAEEAMKQATEAAENGEPPVDNDDPPKEAEETKTVESDAQEALKEAEAAAEGDDQTTSDDETELGPLEPPTHWSADDQEVFRGCTKDVQEWVQGFAERQVQPIQEQLTQLQPVKKVLDNFGGYLDKIGQPADKVVEGLLQTEYVLRTGTPAQKQQALTNIVKSYGIDVAPARPQALPEEIADNPVAQVFDQRLNDVMGALETLQGQVNSNFTAMQTEQQNAAQRQLEVFKTATDDKGNLKHPYYSEVESVMDALAAAANARGQQTTLEEIYDSACMATPAVRAKIESAQRAAQIRERQTKAADKSRASKSVSSSPGGERTAQVKAEANESVYETALKALEAHGGQRF